MSEWRNRFVRLGTKNVVGGEVVHEFRCRCAPDSRPHEQMVSGALRNMSEEFYLEDGVAVEEVPE